MSRDTLFQSTSLYPHESGRPDRGARCFTWLFCKLLSRQASLITSLTHLVMPWATSLMRVPSM